MKEVMEILRRYLQFWDPIEVVGDLIKNGFPPDEYDSYAGPLYTILANGGSVDDIERYLQKCLEHMGMPFVSEREKRMAISIHTYFNKSSGFRK
ncbi:hypothetical protein [Bdellovibrio sp. HCB-162]|uniref:hypothetical protein n=1 Tax=Bdellovibrio sp. HCB-162 TaxID=3394234 RepID=UPI0039BC8D54